MYNKFDSNNHLKPDFSKKTFQELKGSDLGWELLEPINIATDDEESEVELSMRLSPGQKALYFIWYLDGQVTNGGFIQFYWNGYRKYLEPILEGLKLIGDNEMFELVEKADKEFLANQDKFSEYQKQDDYETLCDKLAQFDELDESYYELNDETMSLIEKYARRNPDEFVNLVE